MPWNTFDDKSTSDGLVPSDNKPWTITIFCLLLGVSSDYAQPITGQVTEVTCPVIGRAQPELTPSKRQKTGPELVFTRGVTIHRCTD